MAGPFGVGPSAPGNTSFRAAPVGVLQRPLPVTSGRPTVMQPQVLVPGRLPSTLSRPLPVTGLTPPSRGGFNPQQPSVLVPGGVQTRPLPTVTMPTNPGVTVPTVGRPTPGVTLPPSLGRPTPSVSLPNRGTYTPTQPGVLVPGGQPTTTLPGSIPGGRPQPTTPFAPSTQNPGMVTQPGPTYGNCGMFNNYGIIGFFDHTVGALVKRLMGMRDTCTPGATGPGFTSMQTGPTYTPTGPRALR